MDKMEKYFKSIGCKYALVDVFAYNENGFNFYNKNGYHERMKTLIKKIDYNILYKIEIICKACIIFIFLFLIFVIIKLVII